MLDRDRLATVTGPGGAGKTRLAAEVARQVAGRHADGAWLAELAPVRDPALVPAVVPAALGVREQPGVPAAKAVAQVLARQQLLLVLGNCEHMIGAAAELCAGLLAACDDVRILATSREPLAVGISHEDLRWAWPLAARAAHDLADTAATGDLVALLDSCLPRRLTPMQRAERGLVRARLAAAADDPAAVDAAFAAAIAGLRQHSSPYHLAHGLLDYAAYLAARGEAEAATGEARGIAQRLGCQPLMDRAETIELARPRTAARDDRTGPPAPVN